MEITYQHANPGEGNESFLLRVDDGSPSRTPCVLVDAGDGVSADGLLADDDYLAAICLTHAHVDHYRSLDRAHVDDAPILTSPGTAATLADVFTEGRRHYGLDDGDVLLDHVEGIDGWYDVVEDTIRVHPVPAGHAPGACGFLVRIDDGGEPFHALATGDFTVRDTAGYPGFDPDDYPGIDALFLTASTDEGFEATLTETVGTLTRRASEGSTTLCTASGLAGVHLATVLATVADEFDRSLPVVLAGQVAKLYEALAYDFPNVETVPTFSDPTECLRPGAVTVAGPEVPVEGSSERLFEAIRDDPNATLVQVQGGRTDARDAGDARGTVTSTSFVNHPSESVLDEVVETISPAHTVVVHQRGPAGDRYKDEWDTYTWATGNGDEQALYRDGSIVPPPWVGDATRRRVRTRDGAGSVVATQSRLLDAVSPPTVGRRDELDLAAEGIDLDRLERRIDLGRPADVASTSRSQTTDASGTAADGSERPAVADGGLYDTTGVEDVQGTATPVIVEDDGDECRPESLFDTVSPTLPTGEAEDDTADDADADESADGEPETQTDGVNETADTAAADVADGVEEEPETEHDDATDAEVGRAESEGDEGVGQGRTAVDETATETDAVEIDPVLRALAVRHAEEEDVALETVVGTAVEELLADVLRGDATTVEPPSETDAPSVSVEADTALAALLERAMPAGSADREAFVRRTLCAGIGVDVDERTVPVTDAEGRDAMVDAVVENDDFSVDDRTAVVECALERYVLS